MKTTRAPSKKLYNSSVALEYIETNASWCVDDTKAELKLEKLMNAGVNTLLISFDTFHAEFVPIENTLRLKKLCDKTGMDYFFWKSEFTPMLSKLNPARTYSELELCEILGGDYIKKSLDIYGCISFNGRALKLAEQTGLKKSLKELLELPPCREVTGINHFHVDLYGNYIPPGCTGMGIPLEDLKNGITAEKYPIYHRLAVNGLKGLYEFAIEKGFSGKSEYYYGKCRLCFALRKYLIEKEKYAEIREEIKQYYTEMN